MLTACSQELQLFWISSSQEVLASGILGNLLQTSDTGLPLKPNLISVSLGLVRCISKQAPQVILTCTDGKINPTPLGIDARMADLSPLIGI